MSNLFRIIPRVAHYGQVPEDEAILILPDLPAKAGMVACYARLGVNTEKCV